MSTMSMKRREILSGITLGGTAIFLAARAERAVAGAPTGAAGPSASAATSVFAGKHAVVPLPFDPRKLVGISEKMIVSHHDNNYAAAVKNLNKVEEQLATIGKDTPGYVVSGLAERALTFSNSMILHTQYFGNLGGTGKVGGAVEKRLAAGYGGIARFEEHFRAVGASLGGGSGWTILDYNFFTGDLRTYWAGNHTQALASGFPLLVMDMYEHAYAIDYGAAAGKYIDAFFQNVNWDEVNRRLDRATKAAAILAG
jgi:superoxide dismutase, Fe-Mn family